ncbi:putative aldouronate transport system substrate-binding protein [Paenibacillus sp. 1_12]|uniref:extracellular solute-binding protein n=1 Tax=Paenibacillus sp. 1_12 TaxID=1566278 RepID=UPI0008EC52B4|nr:extracellular solute-binding protein [Paenibacillus sp. 1_12]SFL36478.1 putative aldouronate transport system substrate-binding protein [Paenibacillus sp. 1_12]
MKNRNRFIVILALLATVGCTAQNAPNSAPAASNNAKLVDVTLTRMGEDKAAQELTPPHHFFEELEKKTGIKTKNMGGAGMNTQEFNLILASNDLPDVWMNNWLNFPGGPKRAIDQGYILKLNDVIDKYAPNFKKVLQENPQIAKDIRTDDGAYYAFPFIRSEFDKTYVGPIIRKDWLDELQLPVPATIDEWYTVLKAFKEKKNAAAPLTFLASRFFSTGAFSGAFGVMNGFYLENEQVVFGNMQPKYKDFMILMRKWYVDGLLDKDFASIDSNTVDRKMTTGSSGAAIQLGSRNDQYHNSTRESLPQANYMGIAYPALQKGVKSKFGHLENAYPGGNSGAISAKSKNVEAAAKWLDYFYSKEGSTLVTYGTEGVSYTMENGKVKYTDLILKNPDKLTVDQARQVYGKNTNFPQIQRDAESSRGPKWIEAIGKWRDTDHEKYAIPPITHTTEESNEIAQIMADINAYVLETEIKYILGTISIDTFDDNVNTLKKMGIEKAIKLKQAAYDRYKKR